MSMIICPWCQSEIIREEGAEPEKWCPVCENELDGYRTLTINLAQDEEDLEEDEELPAHDGDLTWDTDNDLREKNAELLLFEEQAEKLLDEQDVVPECPSCREYMVEAGEQIVPEGNFHPRLLNPAGQAFLEAPFKLTVYVCSSCFTVSYSLSEEARLDMMRRLGLQKS